MGSALFNLMAYMLAPTIIIYWAAISFLGGKNLTPTSKAVGFAIALPSAAIAALTFAPMPSVASAETMFWQGSAVGAIIGAAVILGIGKRRNSGEAPMPVESVIQGSRAELNRPFLAKTCKQCGNHNEATATKCSKCSFSFQ